MPLSAKSHVYTFTVHKFCTSFRIHSWRVPNRLHARAKPSILRVASKINNSAVTASVGCAMVTFYLIFVFRSLFISLIFFYLLCENIIGAMCGRRQSFECNALAARDFTHTESSQYYSDSFHLHFIHNLSLAFIHSRHPATEIYPHLLRVLYMCVRGWVLHYCRRVYKIYLN